MICPICNEEAVAIERKKSNTLGGIIGGFLFVISLFILFFNLIAGAVIMILGFIINAFSKGKYTAMICPKCKKVLSKLE